MRADQEYDVQPADENDETYDEKFSRLMADLDALNEADKRGHYVGIEFCDELIAQIDTIINRETN